MKVFISWSGELSKKIAKVIYDWLPCVVQDTKVFMSSEDIEKGKRWSDKVSKELDESNFGIVCLTRENLHSDWIHFESGAISKRVGDSNLCPVLIDLKISDIIGPLKDFQCTLFTKEDMSKLVSDINKLLPNQIENIRLIRSFDALWTGLQQDWDTVIRETPKTKKTKTPTRSTEEIMEEILKNTRNISNAIYSVGFMLMQPEVESTMDEMIERYERERKENPDSGIDSSELSILET